MVPVLAVARLIDPTAVNAESAIHQTQGIPRYPHASFDIIVSFVNGSCIVHGVIKDHHIVVTNFARTPQSMVTGRRFFEVRGPTHKRHGVVRKGKRKPCHREPGAVTQFAYKQKIAHHQAFFHRGGGDGIGFDHKGPDERGHHDSKDHGFQPFPGFGFGAGTLGTGG